jgi:hypothetical protein
MKRLHALFFNSSERLWGPCCKNIAIEFAGFWVVLGLTLLLREIWLGQRSQNSF